MWRNKVANSDFGNFQPGDPVLQAEFLHQLSFIGIFPEGSDLFLPLRAFFSMPAPPYGVDPVELHVAAFPEGFDDDSGTLRRDLINHNLMHPPSAHESFKDFYHSERGTYVVADRLRITTMNSRCFAIYWQPAPGC